MKTLRSLLGLLIVVAAIYTAWHVLPPYYANFQFEEVLDDVSRMATVPPLRSDQELRDTVVRQAQGLDIPISPEQVVVEHASGEVYLSAEYTVHVDLPLYPLDLHFEAMSKNKKRRM